MGSGESRGRAPATIANIGPGFDVFGMAIRGLGDEVLLRAARSDSLEVEGPEGQGLPASFERNTAGIVLQALRRASGVRDPLEVLVRKGVPPGRGLGSSAASGAAAAVAFVRAYPETARLGAAVFLRAAVEGEAAVAGRHYDNVAAALLGGFVSIGSAQPLVLVREPVSPRIHLAVAVPATEMRTAEMRKVLPRQVRLQDAVSNVGKAATLALALVRGDAVVAGRCLEDRIAEPRRVPFLRGFEDVRAAALEAGATGCAMAGSGSTVFAIAPRRALAEQSAKAMRDAFGRHETIAKAFTTHVDNSVPLRPALPKAGPRFSLVTP